MEEAWEDLRASKSASLDYKPRPRAEVVRGPYKLKLIGNCFLDAARFRENCFCVGFICGDLTQTWPDDKRFFTGLGSPRVVCRALFGRQFECAGKNGFLAMGVGVHGRFIGSTR